MPLPPSSFTTRSAPCLVRVKTSARSIAGSRSVIVSSACFSAWLTKVDVLVDALGGGRRGLDRHRRRIVQELVGQLADRRAASSPRRTASGACAGTICTILRSAWMKPRSSIWSASSSTRISIIDEADEALLDQVEQAARRGDEDVDAAAHVLAVLVDAGAAEHGRDRHAC